MTNLAALCKMTCSTGFALLLASACGGNSFSSSEEPQGGRANGGSSSGGSTSQAGKQQGGSSSGTTHGAGTSSGGSSTAGTGGGSPGGEACNAPPLSGSCNGYFEAWYHDPSTGLCRPFAYGGCAGNKNNYPTFEDCQKACPGGSPNYDACSAPTDCMITGTGCCGVCDSPDVSRRELMAFHRKYAGVVQQCALKAAEGAAPPGDIACAPCLPVANDSGSLKYFVPNCVQGQCVVEDIRTSAVSACEVDEECYVRNGSSCCGSCSKQSIALNKYGGFKELVCGDTLPPCDACAPPLNADTAVCGRTGHCELQLELPVGGG